MENKKMTKIKGEDLGTYKGRSGDVVAEINIKSRLIGTKNIAGWNAMAGYGVDYYHSDIFFYSLNYDLGRLNKYENKLNFQFGCDDIGTIFRMLEENSDSIANLLDPRKPNKWGVVRCIFSLEEKTKHLYKERAEAKEKRKEKLKIIIKKNKK